MSQISELVVFDVIYYSCSFLCGKYRFRILSPQTCLYAEKALLWPSEDPLSSFRRSGGDDGPMVQRSGQLAEGQGDDGPMVQRSGRLAEGQGDDGPVLQRSGQLAEGQGEDGPMVQRSGQ